MRVNLTIQRNRLEDINVLWNIAQSAHQTAADTVSRFLAQVDEKFPLEADDWGLDDYVVHVNGFECLHYEATTEILREGDHVIIRPLETTDVRARTLGGRHQISANGQTLIDGIPFGKPFLRSLSRPRIHIPPRKRRRLTYDQQDALLLTNGEESRSVTLSDVDAEESQLSLLNSGEVALLEQDSSHALSRKKSDGAKKVVRFTGLPSNGWDEEEEDDEDEDEDFDPDGMGTDEEGGSELDDDAEPGADAQSSSDTSSLSESTSSADSSSEDEEEVLQSTPPTRLNLRGEPSSSSSAQKKKMPVREGQDAEGVQNTPTSVKSPTSTARAPPGEGMNKTRLRNARRRDQNQLQKLKKAGALHSDATMQDMKAWKLANGQNDCMLDADEDSPMPAEGDLPNLGQTTQTTPAKRKTLQDQHPITNGHQNAEFLAKREKLLNDLAAGTVFVDDNEGPEEVSSKAADRPDQAVNSAVAETGPSPKRARLDMPASMRMIFGNLGQRVPKSRADAEAIRNKLATKKAASTATPKPVEPATELDTAPESELWKSRLVLKAYECCEEGITLSTPPYPFVQRWDPQQKLEKKKGKKRKRAGKQMYQEEQDYEGDDVGYEENYDVSIPKDSINANNSYLDYGDAEEEGSRLPPSTQDYPTLIRDQLMGDIQTAAEAANLEEDLPPLPKMFQLKKRPDISKENLLPGAIIAFKQLEMSQATNWSPELSMYLTAEVLDGYPVKETEVALRFARRDRDNGGEKEYDEEGNRVYGKFEMPAMDENDEEEEDDGFRVLAISQLFEGKLVKAAPTNVSAQNEGTKSPAECDLPLASAADAEVSADTPATNEWNGIDDEVTDEALLASEAGLEAEGLVETSVLTNEST